MKSNFELQLMAFIKPFGKYGFIKNQIPQNGRVLDVGCGNNSPQTTKMLRSDIYYVGLDIGDYNQSGFITHFADEYIIITDPTHFADEIEKRIGEFDTVISCHNLEHCFDPYRVLDAMIKSLKPGGCLYIATPDEASINFPKRKRSSLNFFDDSTHQKPLLFNDIRSMLSNNGRNKIKCIKRYRPLIPFLFGLLYEPIAFLTNSGTPFGGSWALYGYENIYIMTKTNDVKF
ncbi:MAG: class I SAM-dependent methyltransferase [Bacteroidales bacterium]|jgi:2-polyprenyl-3-methyl-5-hydroxy-6-metoxy-1,4-benzoquinol methylase|nr:class I SAM-dependent methyltransferase [Bacteroidales bacterium]